MDTKGRKELTFGKIQKAYSRHYELLKKKIKAKT